MDHLRLGVTFVVLAVLTISTGVLFLAAAKPIDRFLESTALRRWQARRHENAGMGPPLIDSVWNVRITGAFEIVLGLCAAAGAVYHFGELTA